MLAGWAQACLSGHRRRTVSGDARASVRRDCGGAGHRDGHRGDRGGVGSGLLADGRHPHRIRACALQGAGVEPGEVFRETVVTERIDDLSGAVTFVVEAADPADPLPDFIPGQYVSVGATLPDGARQLRQYSLVHAPRDGRLAFTVRPVAATADQPAGEVSNWLTTHVRWAKRRPRAMVRTAIRRQPDRRPHRLRARPAGGGRYLPVRRGRVPAVGTRTADSRRSSAHASALRTVQPRRLVAATRYRSIRDGCPLPR